MSQKTVPTYLKGFGVFDLTEEQAASYRLRIAQAEADHQRMLEAVQEARRSSRHWLIVIDVLLTALVVAALYWSGAFS